MKPVLAAQKVTNAFKDFIAVCQNQVKNNKPSVHLKDVPRPLLLLKDYTVALYNFWNKVLIDDKN